jgi:putative NADPH-quinone reductase
MAQRITIIQGHPDPAGKRFCHALADAYAAGAEAAAREVRRIEVSNLDFTLLRTHADWETGTPPASIVTAQEAIGWAEHLVVVYPLWQGMMPALLKGFFEQVFRPGFAKTSDPRLWMSLLKGRSARIVVTMGMPALFYRWYFGAHGLKSLERSILAFIGVPGDARRHGGVPEREAAQGLARETAGTGGERPLTHVRMHPVGSVDAGQ